jgi:hypothetical protein
MFSYNTAASSSSRTPQHRPSALEVSGWGVPYPEPQIDEPLSQSERQDLHCRARTAHGINDLPIGDLLYPLDPPSEPSSSSLPLPRHSTPANPGHTVHRQVARKSTRYTNDLVRKRQLQELSDHLRRETRKRKELEKQLLRLQRLWKVHKLVTFLTARYQEVGIGEIDDLFCQTIPHKVIDLTED